MTKDISIIFLKKLIEFEIIFLKIFINKVNLLITS